MSTGGGGSADRRRDPPRTYPLRTRLTRGWAGGLEREAEAQSRRIRRRRLVVLLAVTVVATVAGVALLSGGDEPTDAPDVAATLPAFVVEPEKRALAPVFERAARVNDLPPALLMALGWRESRWREEALNADSGAIGIGQLLPETAVFVATDLLRRPDLDPAKGPDNILLMARYVRALRERFDGDLHLALASYLQGSTSVSNDGVSESTAAYLRDIDEFRERFAAARAGDAGSPIDPLGD